MAPPLKTNQVTTFNNAQCTVVVSDNGDKKSELDSKDTAVVLNPWGNHQRGDLVSWEDPVYSVLRKVISEKVAAKAPSAREKIEMIREIEKKYGVQLKSAQIMRCQTEDYKVYKNGAEIGYITGGTLRAQKSASCQDDIFHNIYEMSYAVATLLNVTDKFNIPEIVLSPDVEQRMNKYGYSLKENTLQHSSDPSKNFPLEGGRGGGNFEGLNLKVYIAAPQQQPNHLRITLIDRKSIEVLDFNLNTGEPVRPSENKAFVFFDRDNKCSLYRD